MGRDRPDSTDLTRRMLFRPQCGHPGRRATTPLRIGAGPPAYGGTPGNPSDSRAVGRQVLG
ncbi:hypothetical protein [Terrabacter sp. 2RAF25]|uniref:hypothetical protein n=1 Tax=Terrabacter sp. 2RAF25 TaxID=3232998 RepID=UPI003F9DB582